MKRIGIRGWRFNNREIPEEQSERLFELAYEDFCRNLERLRAIVPVETICMHGSPLSRISNLDLWKRYDYKGLGIIAEPYLDIDYNQVFYITDTGRKWNNKASSIRDRVDSRFNQKNSSQLCCGVVHLVFLLKPKGRDLSRPLNLTWISCETLQDSV